jgi:predicted metal-binding protein
MKEKTKFKKFIKKFKDECKRRGVDFFKVIKPSDLIVREWVRNKCLFGCDELRWYCPPFTKNPEETKKLLKEYKRALLIGFKNIITEDQQRKAQITIFELEKLCFLNGYYKAFGLFPGPCKLCKKCSVSLHLNKIIKELTTLDNNLSSITFQSLHKKYCRRSKEARPSMEALGIDVFSTLKKLGKEINIIKHKDEDFLSFGLILIE